MATVAFTPIVNLDYESQLDPIETGDGIHFPSCFFMT